MVKGSGDAANRRWQKGEKKFHRSVATMQRQALRISQHCEREARFLGPTRLVGGIARERAVVYAALAGDEKRATNLLKRYQAHLGDPEWTRSLMGKVKSILCC
jgi:hypothetical protein